MAALLGGAVFAFIGGSRAAAAAGPLADPSRKVEKAIGRPVAVAVPVGPPAPEFELESVTGERVSLATLRSAGQPVLLSIFADIRK